MCWDVGAVPQVGRLARFDTGASVYSAPMAISDDGRYVLAATFNGTSHVVIDRVSGGQIVRGIFSATQIARQLGVAIPIFEVAHTFAEIAAALKK